MEHRRRTGEHHPHQLRLFVGAGLSEYLIQLVSQRILADVEARRDVIEAQAVDQGNEKSGFGRGQREQSLERFRRYTGRIARK